MEKNIELNMELNNRQDKKYQNKQDPLYKLYIFMVEQRTWAGAILLIATLGFLLEYTGYWWTAFIAGFIGGLLLKKKSAINAFTAGFIGMMFGWGVHMSIISFYNSVDNLNKLSSLFGVNAGVIITITIALGAIFGGLGAINGEIFIRLIQELKKRNTKEEKEV